MSAQLAQPPTKIAADSQPLLKQILAAQKVVLCGRNNSGKSFLLRQLAKSKGAKTAYLGPSRYYNFDVFPRDDHMPKAMRRRDAAQKLEEKKRNVDQTGLSLARDIMDLSDANRKKFFELIDSLLGTKTSIAHTAPDNAMSPAFISVDGYNLSYTSSGYRLIMALLVFLLDTETKNAVIDEPEIGLSPEMQGIIADLILNDFKKHFPHIDSVILGTHSPIFLDRAGITNNYFVSRSNSDISIQQQKTVQDINSLQFFLLGNRFESLYLPSSIVLVEGICDYSYLKRLLIQRFPNALISVIHANGDSRIKELVHFARQMLSDIQRSPYANRIFVVLDKVHDKSLIQALEQAGVAKENVIVWDANGIEYLYPQTLLEKHFGKFTQIEIAADRVLANGISTTKKELCDFVVSNLTDQHELPAEMEKKLMEKLKAVLF